MKPSILLKKLGLLSGTKALDIGARDCSNAIDLINVGFNVDAVDTEDCPAQCNSENIKYIKSRFEDFCPDVKYDLIVARHVIPFLSDPIESSLEKIVEMLSERGVLYLTVFGEDDEWLNNPKVKITNLESVIKALKKYGNIAYKAEERFEGKKYSGDVKRWHVITVVFIK